MKILCFCIIALGLMATACEKPKTQNSRGSYSETSSEIQPLSQEQKKQKIDPPNDPHALVEPLTAEQSLDFFKNQCLSCHDSQNGAVKSFWAMDHATFSPSQLATSAMGATVYFVLHKKAFKLDEAIKPYAMPNGYYSDDQRLTVKRLLRWFDLNLPDLVLASSQKYGFETSLEPSKIISSFSCSKPISQRQFLVRLISDAFDRLPTPQELALLGDQADQPTKSEDRQKLAKKMFEDPAWRNEFLNVGLRKFARKLSGAGSIRPYLKFISESQASDLQDEFYQLLLRDFDQKSFKDTLLTQSIPVSSQTAGFYGCPAPATSWESCPLEEKRKSYFASMSFLRASSSSFLSENNNYKRVATLQFMILGDTISPATDGPLGEGAVQPLPACLQSQDYRGVIQNSGNIAPFGSSSVPSHGNLCQSCHIDRYLAAGSILFRPFNQLGFVYGSTPDLALSQDPDFPTAVEPRHVNTKPGSASDPVTEVLLNQLLNQDTENACVLLNGTTKKVNTLSDLAEHIVGDGKILGAGLARHIPRALSNLSYTSEEIFKRIRESYENSQGKLGPVFQAYFASETYGCARQDL